MVRPFPRTRAAMLSRACARPSVLVEALEPRVLLSAAPVGASKWRLNPTGTGWFIEQSSQTTKPRPLPTPTTSISSTTTPTAPLALLAAVAPTIKFGPGAFPADGNYHPAMAVAYASNGTTPVSGTFAYTYNGSPTPPTVPGDYAVVATFASKDAGYTGATAYTTISVGPSAIVPAVGALTHVTQTNNVFTYFVDSGSVTFGADLAAMGPFNLNVASGASAIISSRQTLGSLTLGSNATLTITNTGAPKPIVVKSLSIGSGAKLDLAANDLIVDYTGQSNPATALRSLLATGYSAGTWAGKGLTSSAAQANLGTMSLNLFDNAAAGTPFTQIDGVPVGLQTALVKYTYVADLLANGTMDSNDAIVFANNYADGGAATHQFGDINYNGIFDSNDAILFANAYSEATAPMPIAVPNAPDQLGLLTTSNVTINVSWRDNSSTETAYLVQRSANGTTFATVATLAPNTTAWQDTGLTPDTKYFYRVIAANASGNSPATVMKSDTTLPTFTRTIWVDAGYVGATKNGNFATPYTTIAAAMGAIVTNSIGNGIVARQGTYNEKVTVKPDTTLMSLPNELATVTGFTSLGQAGWVVSPTNPNIYQYTTTINVSTLFSGYIPQDLARSPNSGWWNVTSVSKTTESYVDGAGVIHTTYFTTISDPTHLAGIPSLVGGYIQAHVAAGNAYDGAPIYAHDNVAGTITTRSDLDAQSTNNMESIVANDYYVVKNKLSLLDGPGEWMIEQSATPGQYVVSYWPINGDLSNMQTRTATTAQIAVVNGGHDITIRGLEITGNTGYGVNISGGTPNRVIVRDNIVHHNASSGIMFRYANNVEATNNYIAANGTGLSVSSVNTGTLKGNEVAYNTIDGIIVAGDISGKAASDPAFIPTYNITVQGNYSHHNLGYSHSDGIQMYRTVYNTDFIRNLVMNNGQGLMTEEMTDIELNGNIFWNTAAYTVIGKTNSVTWNVQNNTIGGAGYGPYNFIGSPGVTATENITIGQTTYYSPAPGDTISNRNFYYNPVATRIIALQENLDYPVRYRYYNTVAEYYAYSGQDATGASGNPLFINAPTVSTMANGNKTLNTTTKLYVNSVTGFAVGDHIEINGDGVVRTVTATTSGTNNNTITFDLPLPSPPMTEYTTINNWKTKTDYTLDLRLQAGSPAGALSSTGGPVGATFSIPQYMANDFNGDGYRDIPLPSTAVLAGLPDSVNWSPPTY